MSYAHDPHIDPQLSWAGKGEHTSFEVPTVSLHVHERNDPRTVIEAVRRRNGADPQLSLSEEPEENPPIRQAIEFYRHRHNWTNRLIAGDSLLVMRQPQYRTRSKPQVFHYFSHQNRTNSIPLLFRSARNLCPSPASTLVLHT